MIRARGREKGIVVYLGRQVGLEVVEDEKAGLEEEEETEEDKEVQRIVDQGREVKRKGRKDIKNICFIYNVLKSKGSKWFILHVFQLSVL